MLDAGADVNAPAAFSKGVTALQAASIYGYLGIVLRLLEHQADVNAPAAEEDGRTALEGAAEHGRMDLVHLLLNAGVERSGQGYSQYQRAMSLAAEHGHLAVRNLLEASGPDAASQRSLGGATRPEGSGWESCDISAGGMSLSRLS